MSIVDNNTAELFDKQGYVVVRNFVGTEKLWEYSQQLALKATKGDYQIAGSPNAYCDPVMQKLLVWALPKVEQVVGKKLYKTCSYWRMYKLGDVLRIHKDRPACEVSLSLTLGHDNPEPWPLYIMNKDEEPIAVSLKAGDALFYKGLEMHHWRGINKWGRQAQVFLHYVNQAGPHAEWKNDKRKE